MPNDPLPPPPPPRPPPPIILPYGVVSVTELAGLCESEQAQDFTRAYKRVFQVITSTPKVGGLAVRLAVVKQFKINIGCFYELGTWDKVFNTGDPWHEFDPGAFCNGIRAQQVATDGLQWTVIVSYGPWNPDTRENPLLQPAEVEFDFLEYESICDEDVNGDPITNSAGDPFDPPVVKDNSRPVIRITRNEKTFPWLNAYRFRDKVNDAPFFDVPERCVKCKPPKSRRAYNVNTGGDDGWYWVVSYVFEVNEDTWDAFVLDQGLRNEDGPIIEKGAPISSPALLGGGFLQFQVYEEADFSVFDFEGQ